jgi:Spy/CpxP family protein refolding chaperone
MKQVIAALAAIVFIVLGTALQAAQSSQQPSRWKWWQDDKTKAEIGLTEEQASEVELVFRSALPKLKEAKSQLDTLEEDLSRMIRERTADESAVASQIDRVEAARSELSKTRTLMLYRMHRILTPEQNTKVQAIHDRWQKEHGRTSRRPRSN